MTFNASRFNSSEQFTFFPYIIMMVKVNNANKVKTLQLGISLCASLYIYLSYKSFKYSCSLGGGWRRESDILLIVTSSQSSAATHLVGSLIGTCQSVNNKFNSYKTSIF